MSQGLQLIAAGKSWSRTSRAARVSMPKSTREYLERGQRYPRRLGAAAVAQDGVESMAAMVVGETAQNEEPARAL